MKTTSKQTRHIVVTVNGRQKATEPINLFDGDDWSTCVPMQSFTVVIVFQFMQATCGGGVLGEISVVHAYDMLKIKWACACEWITEKCTPLGQEK